MTANISFIHDRQSVSPAVPVEGESQELVDVLQKIVRNAGALLEVRNCSIALLDTTGTMLVTMAALQKNGRKPRNTRFHLSEGVAGWVAQHCESLVISDVNLDPRFKRLGRVPIGSMICVPLLDDDRFIGTLTASSQETHAFDARKVKMMTIFAEQAVLAIINARHAELAQRQANQLEMLMNLSRGITTRLDPDALYRAILVDVQRLVPSDLAVLYRYQEGTQELFPVAELYGADTATALDESAVYVSDVKTFDMHQEKIRLHDSQSVTAWAAVHKHPMLHTPIAPIAPVPSATLPPTSTTPVISTETQTGILAEQKATYGYGIHDVHADSKLDESILDLSDMAELAAPLVSKQVLYGVLSLKRVSPFSSEELRLVRNLSNMAAAAVENVELFHKVRTDQQQLRAILSSSSDGIALLGVNACFIEANAAFGRIFGIDTEQIAGMECMELLGCETDCDEENDTGFSHGQSGQQEQQGIQGQQGHTACRSLCMVHHALQQEEPVPYIELDLTIQGVSRSVGLSLTPVSTMSQPVCLMMARDVTAIRDATRMKANFVSMITHELRSPLNAINGYLDLTLSGVAGEPNEQMREFLMRARSGSETLYALIEDLLLVTRADAGHLRMSREVIDLQDIIRDAVEELELTAQDRGIHLNVEIDEHFPQLYADPVRLQQVLRNLVSNALRFTSSGGSVTVAATLDYLANGTSDTDDRDVRIAILTVRDTGTGIALEHQQRIFDRFYQVPQQATRTTGQGLGLSVVKMIVEAHGGSITVQSVPGQGSTFTCMLPCVLS